MSCSLAFSGEIDDMDNMLGGKLLLEGKLPYSDYFSHHMPGMYFLSAILYIFSGPNPLIFRILFNVILFALLLLICHLIRHRVSLAAGVTCLIAISLGHIISRGYSPVGESLLAFIVILAFIILFMRDKNEYLSSKEILTLCLILAIPPLVSLSYVYVVIPLYIFTIIECAKQLINKVSNLKIFILRIGVIILPYVLLLLFILLNSSLKEFIYSQFTFNANIYAPITEEEGTNIIQSSMSIVVKSLGQLSLLSRNIFNYQYAPQVGLMFGLLFLGLELWRRKLKYAALVALPIILMFINPRVNIFNKAAMTTSFKDLIISQHATPYILFTLFATSIGVVSFFQYYKSYKKLPFYMPASFAAIFTIIVVPISIVSFYIESTYSFVVLRDKTNYYSYQKNAKENGNGAIMNNLAQDNNKVWVASDFMSQIFIKSPRATYFTFYMPWVDQSSTYNSRLVSQLKAEQPKIIYFTGFPDTRVTGYWYTYNSNLKEYINNNYIKSSDSRLSGYYFLKSDYDNISSRLIDRGYEL